MLAFLKRKLANHLVIHCQSSTIAACPTSPEKEDTTFSKDSNRSLGGWGGGENRGSCLYFIVGSSSSYNSEHLILLANLICQVQKAHTLFSSKRVLEIRWENSLRVIDGRLSIILLVQRARPLGRLPTIRDKFIPFVLKTRSCFQYFAFWPPELIAIL